MLAMSNIENGPDAQLRITPTEKPSPEIVCLVDDDPLVLRSTGLLLTSDGVTVRRFDKGEDFIAYVASHQVPLVVLDIDGRNDRLRNPGAAMRHITADSCDRDHRTRRYRRAGPRDANRHSRVLDQAF